MLTYRIIPVLLLRGNGLVKSVKFSNFRYVGDPINAVRIFNEKGVDELTLLDITATLQRRKPDFELIASIASECFMPVGYGGGICSLQDIGKLFNLGVEKAIINTAAVTEPQFIKEAVDCFGSQSIILSLDVKKSFLGKYEVYTHCGRNRTGRDPLEVARELEKIGVGEILINSIDRDGTMRGYDIPLIKKIAQATDIPLVACGGAGNLQDMVEAVKVGGASAAAAGSLFVFFGQNRAVLINYPEYQELREALGEDGSSHG